MATITSMTDLGEPVLMRAVYDMSMTTELGPYAARPPLGAVQAALSELQSFIYYATLVTPPRSEPFPDWFTPPATWTWAREAMHVRDYTVYGSYAVRVSELHMQSPLTVVLEIPPPVWVAAAFGFVALAERLATSPVRIARKRKEELMKSARLDQKIEAIARIRADALAESIRQGEPKQARINSRQINFSVSGESDGETVPLVDDADAR